MTLFIRLLDAEADKKGPLLRDAVNADSDRVFEVDPTAFEQVPGSPFAYWVSDRVREVFKRLPAFEGDGRTAKQGLATADDFRFVRTWWEVDEKKVGRRWFGFAKGGSYSPFYADVFLVVNWASDGHEMKAWAGSLYNESHWSRILKNTEFYFRPGLTWPRRTQSGLAMRVMPAGCLFADKGPACYIDGDNAIELAALLACGLSVSFRYLVEVQMAFGSYEVGVIQRTPVPRASDRERQALYELGRYGWSMTRALDTGNETSHAAVLPSALRSRVAPLDPAVVAGQISDVQMRIDDLAFSLYGIAGRDRAEIELWGARATRAPTPDSSPEDVDNDEGEGEQPQGLGEVDTLLSWCVGVAFGRFDVRLATGERLPPPDPEPFDPLPTRSPAMVPEGDQPFRSPAVMLVDDPGHRDDLATLIEAVLEKARVPASPRLAPEAVRQWLAAEFFPLHIKMYSRSRRKAPIYWQLATSSASYSVWLYIHAFDKDTLYHVQNDYVAPKLAHEERRLESLRAEAGASPTSAQRRQLAAQEAFVEELRAMLEEVKRAAPLWNPDLDDGVVINFAPLWRLVPQNKPWQRELTTKWDALCNGEYDWAHLAMNLWPERVVPKCASDRSLAIAHGLEQVFWFEDADGKWKARDKPLRPVEELIRERSSAAVKAALDSLLKADVAAANGRARTRRRGSR